MARFFVATLCVATTLLAGAYAMTTEEFGFEMGVKAYEAVCWYENLKQFPNTNSKGFNQCSGQAKFQKDQIMTKDFFNDHPELRKEYYGKWTADKVIGKLPSEYKSKCGGYLKTPDAAPASDESDALNDAGNDYPYKAYAYCLLSTLRAKHGDQAIDAVKTERTHAKKHWMQALLDRENEFRARHGVEPLKLVKDLNTAAQEWADTNANECNMYHSKNSDEGRQFRGQGTGESLAAGGGGDDKDIAAYQAADGWYEEIKDYPYPIGYQGGDDNLFKKIGHFTQSVWKDSKYVGYGYAYNPDCKPYQRYIAARYYPAGNVEGKFPDNVTPPKDA